MELDMDKICELLKKRGIPAIVEQTGGGTATIYAGELRKKMVKATPAPLGHRSAGSTFEERWQASAGPGWFKGPGWTNGRADTDEFYVGTDDDGEGEYVAATDQWTEATAADAIAAVVGGN